MNCLRVLNVAKKPSVAKAVSEILARPGGGLLQVDDGVFEFDYTIGTVACRMVVTSVDGHLMKLDFEDRYRHWQSCDPAVLFDVPVRKHIPEDKMAIKQTLEEEAGRCQWLVLWLDCDRERENIAFEVVEVCRGVNPNLNVWRARFSALTDMEIRQSVQNLVRPNKLLNKLFADAVDARQEIDLRLGCSFTRFQTQLLKESFVLDLTGSEKDVILSYSPCQFATLGFIVERYWQIQAHEPKEFWTINCTHTSDAGTTTFSWIGGHLFDYTRVGDVYGLCYKESAAIVKNVKKQKIVKRPPFPLSTLELQNRASKYFGMSSDCTMKVAEELYLSGFISCPRTETDSFSGNTDLQAILMDQVDHPIWGLYAQRLLDPDAGLRSYSRNGGHADGALPPIHPTKILPDEPWSQDHKNLYELVVRHFLACVSKYAVGAETTVDIEIAGEQFSASWRVILESNYLDVYSFEPWGGSLVPTYTIGQQLLSTKLTIDSGKTRAPPLLSETDLLSAMGKDGVGTDATMHGHIQKLLDWRYATKDSNMCFSPTKLGMVLVMGYKDIGYEIWKPYLCSMMESDMDAISTGTKSKSRVLGSFLDRMKPLFLEVKRNKVKLLKALEMLSERWQDNLDNEDVADRVGGLAGLRLLQ